MSTYVLLMAKACKNISAKTLIALKPRIFSPANLSPSTICTSGLVANVNLRFKSAKIFLATVATPLVFDIYVHRCNKNKNYANIKYLQLINLEN